MNAKPDKAKVSRRVQYSSESPPSPLLELPKIDYAEYIIEIAFEIGICQNSELGLVETSWSEISAWCNTMKIDLSNFECATIKRLSRCYVDQIHASKSASEPPPYIDKSFNRETASTRIGNVLRGMASRINAKRKGPSNTKADV